jgi:hypothetical protein
MAGFYKPREVFCVYPIRIEALFVGPELEVPIRVVLAPRRDTCFRTIVRIANPNEMELPGNHNENICPYRCWHDQSNIAPRSIALRT